MRRISGNKISIRDETFTALPSPSPWPVTVNIISPAIENSRIKNNNNGNKKQQQQQQQKRQQQQRRFEQQQLQVAA